MGEGLGVQSPGASGPDTFVCLRANVLAHWNGVGREQTLRVQDQVRTGAWRPPVLAPAVPRWLWARPSAWNRGRGLAQEEGL